MGAIARTDGDDAPWLIGEFVPCVATQGDDLLVIPEDAVREPVLAHELPDVFDGVEFRRSRR